MEKSVRKTNNCYREDSFCANCFFTAFCSFFRWTSSIAWCHYSPKRPLEASSRHRKQYLHWENPFKSSKQRNPLKPFLFCAEKCSEWRSWWHRAGEVNILALSVKELLWCGQLHTLVSLPVLPAEWRFAGLLLFALWLFWYKFLFLFQKKNLKTFNRTNLKVSCNLFLLIFQEG